MSRRLLLLGLMLCGAARAQSIGASISGSVDDAQGFAIDKAKIEIINEETGASIRTEADSQGQFRARSLQPGSYQVTVNHDGFARFRFDHVTLTVGDTRSLRATLLPLAQSTQVTVVDSVSAVQQETSDRSSSFNQKLMNELPMVAGSVGRNFRTQVYLAPGVSTSTQAHRPFAVNGARSRNNNYLVDSNDFNEIEGGLLMGRGASEQLLSTEAIEGMQVLTHNFKAEYGRQNGSVISLVTRRGTNEWHGLLFHYFRNDKLDARNTFDLVKPPVRYNQFGFNFGGPIVKNRTFVFVNNEWFPRRQTNATTVQSIRAEDRSRAVPAVRPLVDLFPMPNIEGTNLFRSSVPTSVDQWSTVMRLDHELTATQHLLWRTTYLGSTNRGVAGASFARYASDIAPQGHTLQHIWTPLPNLVNEARLNYTRFSLYDNFQDPVVLGDPAANGLTGTVAVAGLSQLGQFAFMARNTAQNNFQWTDDLSLVQGPHSLKAGVAIRRLQLNSGTFAPSFTGNLRFNSLNDFLAGRAASYSRNIGNPYIGLRATEYNAYLQDDWKVNARLTLNLGVRYEYNSVPSEVNGLIQDKYRFQPDRNNVAPRFGFAYLLEPQGTTVLRGGYGIYYNVLELSYVGLTRFNPPLIASFTAANPVFPDLLSTARQNVPSGLVLPADRVRQPYSQHLNLTVERQFFNPQTSASLGYVGTLGRKLPRTSRPNGGDALAQTLRPDTSLGVVNVLETAANSSYHSLQATFDTQLKDLTIRTSYTWSKFIDEVTDFPTSNVGIERGLLALDERNWRLNRGVSDLDLPHRFTVAYIYELPWMTRNLVLGGWQVQGITTLQSGRPFTLYSGTDNPQGSNSNRILNVPGSLVLSSGNGPVFVALAPGTSRSSLTPGPGLTGNLGRNTERGDSIISWNASLSKSVAVTERWRLQFRAESFNLSNTTNYDLPDGVLTSATFGRSVLALDPRQIQLALRLSF